MTTKRIVRIAKWAAGIALLVVLALGGQPWPLEIVIRMLCGWIIHAIAILLKVHVNPAGIATAVVCLLAAAMLGHHLCSWIYSFRLAENGAVSSPTRKWQWSWTVKGLFLFVLMFATGLCTIGMTHQIAWLVTSKDPLLEMNGLGGPKRSFTRSDKSIELRLQTNEIQLDQFDR